jgi:hypothetical protein
MRASTRKAAWAGALALLAGAGCSEPKYEFAEVEGQVTLGNKPLAGVIVTFYPDDTGPKQLPYARGTTDASGRYKLSTPDGKAGALVGKNRVVVNWPLPERGDEKAPRARPPGPPIPIPYTQAGQTPLVVEVKTGGPQTIDLPLL